METLVRTYRVIGWHRNITPGNQTASNLSDGAIFSTLDLAVRYWRDNPGFTLMHIRIDKKKEDDPEIDHLIKGGLYKPSTEPLPTMAFKMVGDSIQVRNSVSQDTI